MGEFFRVIVVINDQALKNDEYAALLSLISLEKREILQKRRKWVDAQNSLLGDVLVRRELCRLTGLKNEELQFSKNKHQKPFFVNRPNIHYNLSHSGNIVAVVFDDTPVGIDVEIVIASGYQIAKKIFCFEEYEYFNRLNEIDKLKYLYRTWTMKEAYLKRAGVGLLYPMRLFHADKVPGVRFFSIPLDGQAICHVCASESAEPPIIIEKTIDETMGKDRLNG